MYINVCIIKSDHIYRCEVKSPVFLCCDMKFLMMSPLIIFYTFFEGFVALDFTKVSITSHFTLHKGVYFTKDQLLLVD